MSYNSFSSNHRFGGGRPQGRRFQGGIRRRQTFDPSLLVQKAMPLPEIEFVPNHTFADFNLTARLLQNIERRGYLHPTQIQDAAIPELLASRDMIGIANTGTGKTAAFLIPLINKVSLDPDQRVLIVAPTRELAVQIEQEFRVFSEGMQLFSTLCIGGVNINPQIRGLQRHPQFVIGTPGRLRDLEDQRRLNFVHFNNIVLDEVDQMLDMGFVNEIKYIASQLLTPRQSLFFSATLPERVKSVMHAFLTDPVTITVKSNNTAANIEQDVIKTNGRQKIDILDEMLRQDGFDKVLVFSQTKRATEKLAQMLDQRGVAVVAVHGNKTQGQRQRALDLFKRNHVQVLIATDVASRGLDIDDVTHVINFDLPETYEDYVHRIGRTGRANKKGIALTFVD